MDKLREIHERVHNAHKFCDSCPLDEKNNGQGISCELLNDKAPEAYEKILLDWEKEHPEEVE